MRGRLVLKEVVSLLFSIAFVVLLSIPIGPLPPLGELLNPNGGVWTTAENAVLPAAEEVRVPGLDGNVTVLRDAWGIPHIFAATDHDLFFAMGYVHAQDRMFQMDLEYRLAAGRLSEILGKSYVETDAWMRTVGLARDSRRFVNTLGAGDVGLQVLQAYADGVNAWIARAGPKNMPLEYKLLGFAPEPWAPVKSVTLGALIAYGLSADFTDVELGLLQDGLGPAAVDELFPVTTPTPVPPIVPNGTRGGGPAIDPEAGRDILRRAGLVESLVRPLRSIGSNNWIVDGTRSATGRPILAGDPHLSFQLPALWYEVQLTGGAYDAYGVSFPGAPAILIGFNRYLANSETNTGADVTDFYRETVNASDPNRYLFRNRWRDFNVTQETIHVKGGADVVVTVKESLHGPLVTERGETVAMKWTGREFGSSVGAALQWMKARSWPEFREALRSWKNPAQNFAVAAWDSATATGTIAVRSNGQFPIRNNTLGRVPLDGASGNFEWIGNVSFDEYPEAVNPPEGYLASANQLPAGSGYPHYLGWLWDPGYRARRINALLNDTIARNGTITFQDMRTFQLDEVDTAAMRFSPSLLNATATCRPDECVVRDLLRAWDFRMAKDSAAATIWHTFYYTFLGDTFGDEWARANVSDLRMPYPDVLEHLVRSVPTSPWFDDVRTLPIERRDDILRRAFSETVAALTAEDGPVGPSWAWGLHHTRVFEHLTGLDTLSRGPYPSGGDEVTLSPAAGFEARAGASWRMVVNLGAPQASVTVYPGGQSGNPLSPHYDDQLALWLRGEYKAILFPTMPTLPPGRLESTLILRRA
ncbi:MAG TPA: penicillin acylase family protein [Thermoplasmata archaeon]